MRYTKYSDTSKALQKKRLFFKKIEVYEIEIYTDADWTDSIEHQRSTTRYCTFLLITWSSKKQNVIAGSSAKTEFWVVAQGIYEGLWLRKLLEELQMQIKFPFKIYYDNKAAIIISLNHFNMIEPNI